MLSGGGGLGALGAVQHLACMDPVPGRRFGLRRVPKEVPGTLAQAKVLVASDGPKASNTSGSLRAFIRRTQPAQNVLTVSLGGALGKGATAAMGGAAARAANDGLRKVKLSDISLKGTREAMTKTLVQWSLLESLNNAVRARLNESVKDLSFPGKKHWVIFTSGLMTSMAVASAMVPARRLPPNAQVFKMIGKEALLSCPVCLVRSYAQEPTSLNAQVAKQRRAWALMAVASAWTAYNGADFIRASKSNIYPLVGHMAISASVSRVSNEIYSQSKAELTRWVNKLQAFAAEDEDKRGEDKRGEDKRRRA